ncbi:hypothetical protein BDR26DRAFT_849874 [Obelidium mucronatum]|nr:hypothetical protein BDR26DRAFT_849874 [Obelidium mucronatum]
MLFVAQPPTTPTTRYVPGGAPSPTVNPNTSSNVNPNNANRSSSSTSFRRSYIVCQPDGNATTTNTTSSVIQPGSEGTPTIVATSTTSYKQAYEKSQSRIASLEKTIEFLQEQHKGSLKDLHKEIARLQNLCSDVSFVEVVHESRPNSAYFNEESDEMRAPWSKTVSGKDTVIDINDDLTKPLSAASEIDETKPYFVLLQQQRRKYLHFIERMNADNKRKQGEIDTLRAELELVRDVLSVSGLDVDLVQLRGLVNGKEKAKELTGRAKKVNVLPPIGAEVPVPAGQMVNLADAAGNVVSGVVADSRLQQQRFVASPPPPLPKNAAERMEHLRHKPKDYHNANLDYQGRAHLYSVPPAPGQEGFALSAEKTDGTSELVKDLPKAETVLPPISSPVGQPKFPLDPFFQKSEKMSSWTKRMKGTQILRQKRNNLNK